MKFKIDENLPLEAALILVGHGHDASTVWAEHLSGADDQVIAAQTRTEQRVLITLDLDCADLRAFPPGDHAGIIVLRLKSQDKARVISHVRRVSAILHQRNPTGELWIVEADGIRFRQGPKSTE